ncbi:hypothetical protein BpHYR1_033084 [Brachionus plicatilis]|uniref:Uncharacterized protein n=1 Tax=Brachionus plicatilis TaxID=10195 RepID=A0A3M7RJ06_BRAPC|nr:hypothetical protein BpHYR1_033084 [Brachionus plicatilis]
MIFESNRSDHALTVNSQSKYVLQYALSTKISNSIEQKLTLFTSSSTVYLMNGCQPLYQKFREQVLCFLVADKMQNFESKIITNFNSKFLISIFGFSIIKFSGRWIDELVKGDIKKKHDFIFANLQSIVSNVPLCSGIKLKIKLIF